MNEVSVSFHSEVELKGSLVFPKEDFSRETFPALLLLHGSGPVDRDENAKQGKTNVFKLLSDAIVSHGFAVLRYDKRGVGESKGNYDEAGLFDFVDDAEAAFAFLQSHPNIDRERIFVLGHSEGCTLAILLQQRKAARGLILLAGAAESLKTTILRQGEEVAQEMREMTGWKGKLFRLFNVSDKVSKQQASILERVEKSSEPVIRFRGQKIQAKWMREHMQYNVVEDLHKITCPVLAVTGSKDVQVLPEHAQRFADHVSGESECMVIDNMNHMLRYQEEPAHLLTLKQVYKRSFQQPLDQQLIDVIVNWLNKY